MKTIVTLLVSAILAFGVAGCEQQGPAEEAAERLDNTIDEVGDSADDVGDGIGDAADDVRDGVEDAVDEVADEF